MERRLLMGSTATTNGCTAEKRGLHPYAITALLNNGSYTTTYNFSIHGLTDAGANQIRKRTRIAMSEQSIDGRNIPD